MARIENLTLTELSDYLVMSPGETTVIIESDLNKIYDLADHFYLLGIKCRYLCREVNQAERIVILKAYQHEEIEVLIVTPEFAHALAPEYSFTLN